MTFAGEDVTLLAARSADEGLTMARQARPELVIADGVMPGRSGYDLCSAIKSDPALRACRSTSWRPRRILRRGARPSERRRRALDQAVRIGGADREGEGGHRSRHDRVDRRPVAVRSHPLRPSRVRRRPPRPGVPRRCSPAGAPMDDDYGEISIEESGPQQPPFSTGRAGTALAGAIAASAASGASDSRHRRWLRWRRHVRHRHRRRHRHRQPAGRPADCVRH